METVIEEWLMKKYEGVIFRITRDKKEDLKLVRGRGLVICLLMPSFSAKSPPRTPASLPTACLP